MNKMKKLLKKIQDLIGITEFQEITDIKSDGLKRVLIIVFFIYAIFWYYLWWDQINGWKDFSLITLFFSMSLIFIGIFIKLIRIPSIWIMGRFKKDVDKFKDDFKRGYMDSMSDD